MWSHNVRKYNFYISIYLVPHAVQNVIFRSFTYATTVFKYVCVSVRNVQSFDDTRGYCVIHLLWLIVVFFNLGISGAGAKIA